VSVAAAAACVASGRAAFLPHAAGGNPKGADMPWRAARQHALCSDLNARTDVPWHAESLHADPRCQALEALSRIVLCVHGAIPADAPEAIAPPTAAVLAQALPLLFSAFGGDYERPVAASAAAAFAVLCGGLPQGALAHTAPAIVDLLEGVCRL
jgi:hypothetical protein